MNNTNEDPTGVSSYDFLGLICTALLIALVAFAVAVATGCTMTISADGAKSFSVDGAQAIKAIEIISQK